MLIGRDGVVEIWRLRSGARRRYFDGFGQQVLGSERVRVLRAKRGMHALSPQRLLCSRESLFLPVPVDGGSDT